MAPRDFGSLTLHELELMRAHAERAEKRLDERTAWATAYLMSCWTTKPVTAKQLLGIPEVSQEDTVRELLRARFGDKVGAIPQLSPTDKLNAILDGGQID